MSDKTAMRKVNRGGMFTFMGTEYVIERRGLEQKTVEVFYVSLTGEVDKIRDDQLGESKVQFADHWRIKR